MYWPTDAGAAALFLRTLVANIDHRTFDEDDELLDALLSAAWPTSVAQRH